MRDDAFQFLQHWSEFGNWEWPFDCPYTVGVDTACPGETDHGSLMVASVGGGINAFWYIAQGMEILWVDMPHFWPRDTFEWHENETWWLRYARENDIDITKYVPIGGR